MEKKVGELRGDIVSLDRSWLPLSENPDVHPPKTNRSARTCIQSYPLLNGVGTCQFLKHDVEPRVFTFLWNRYHQWLADIELIHINTFFVFLFQDEPGFHCWKAKRGWDLTLNSRTPKIDHHRIYSLWLCVACDESYIFKESTSALLTVLVWQTRKQFWEGLLEVLTENVKEFNASAEEDLDKVGDVNALLWEISTDLEYEFFKKNTTLTMYRADFMRRVRFISYFYFFP